MNSRRRFSPDQTEPVAERVTAVRDLTPVSLVTAFARGTCSKGAGQRCGQVRNNEIQVHRRPVTRVSTMNFQVVARMRAPSFAEQVNVEIHRLEDSHALGWLPLDLEPKRLGVESNCALQVRNVDAYSSLVHDAILLHWRWVPVSNELPSSRKRRIPVARSGNDRAYRCSAAVFAASAIPATPEPRGRAPSNAGGVKRFASRDAHSLCHDHGGALRG
jgi:hypothetical protein